MEKEKKPVILKIHLAFNVWDIFGASNTSINVDHKANTGMSKYASNWQDHQFRALPSSFTNAIT